MKTTLISQFAIETRHDSTLNADSAPLSGLEQYESAEKPARMTPFSQAC
jgi:hypothetical protein